MLLRTLLRGPASAPLLRRPPAATVTAAIEQQQGPALVAQRAAVGARSAAVPVVQTRHFSKKDKRKGGGGGGASSSGSQAPAHRTAPHHHHSPAVGGVTHNEDLMVDLDKLKAKMERALAALQREFAGVRGGKPDAAMFDHLHVQAYGTSTPLSEVGQVTIKSPTLAVINVYDPELLEAVNTAIKDSKLELNPRIDGNAVTVPLPKPSAETRESYVKLVSQFAEKAKQNVRKVRREGLDKLKTATASASEDDIRRNSKVVEAMTEELVKKCTDMLEKKKKEIMTV